MVRRSARILIELAAATVGGIAILVAVAAWRLSSDEPIRVRFLTPYLEQALTAPDGSFSVAIKDTVLTWAGWDRALDLRARGVEVFGADGRRIAAVPEVAVTLSGRALLHGMVAPTSLDIFGPRIVLVRERDGRFRFVRSSDQGPTDESSPILPMLLGEMLRLPDLKRTTGYINRVRLLGGDIVFDDRRLGVKWHAPQAEIEVRRDAVGLTGRLALTVEPFGRPATLSADFSLDRAKQTISLSADVRDVDMAALGLIEPSLTVLAGANLRLAGRLDTSVGLDGSIGDTTFSIASAPGQVTMPDHLLEPLTVAALSLDGRLEAGGDRLLLSHLAVDFGGPTLEMSGSVDGLTPRERGGSGTLRVRAHYAAAQLPVAELGRYWPLDAAADARAWVVENITAGNVERVEGDLDLTLPEGDLARATVGRIDMDMEATDLTLHYLRPMPPIEHMNGTAHVSASELTADLVGGAAAGVGVDNGHVVIQGLDQLEQYYEITGDLSGKLSDALALIDREPLQYARSFGVDPAKSGGLHATHLKLGFPNVPVRGTQLEDLTFDVTSTLSEAAIEGILMGQSMAGGSLELTLDNAGMRIVGAAAIAGMPATLDWKELFSGQDERSRIALVGTTQAEQRAALGFDLRPYVDGPVLADVVYTRYSDGRAGLAGKFDLGAATMSMPFLAWSKAADIPGQAEIDVELKDGQPVAVPRFTVSAGDLVTAGRARFAPETGSLAAVELGGLRVGRTDLSKVNADIAADFMRITLGGGVLDAEPLLEADDTDEEETKQAFSLMAERLDRIRLGPDREIENVSLSLRHDGHYWDRIDIKGTLPGGSPLSLAYQPVAGGKHDLMATAEDAGAALRVFDIVSSVRGGKLIITGQADDAEPKRPLRGKAEIGEFRVVNAPALARLLSIATLTGLVDALTGEGFLFNRFVGKFVKTDGQLEIKKARTAGPSIGLTAAGLVDFDSDTMDLAGTIVPAYAINSLLGNIPIVGTFLQGGEGEGLFAATYTATGSLDDPTIAVNPLAALAPGFLRGIFEGSASSGDESADTGEATSEDQGEYDFTPLPRRQDTK